MQKKSYQVPQFTLYYLILSRETSESFSGPYVQDYSGQTHSGAQFCYLRARINIFLCLWRAVSQEDDQSVCISDLKFRANRIDFGVDSAFLRTDVEW